MSDNYAAPITSATVPPLLPPVPPIPPLPVIPTPIPLGRRPSILRRFILVFLFLIIISAGAVAGASAVAYEKINIGNPVLELAITRFVLDLPFTPKTARYLLTKAVIAQKEVSKHSLDISLAADSPSFAPLLGSLTGLDGSLKGAVDYADPKNPRLSLNLSLTKDFNADIRKDDRFLYFRINKLPLLLLASLLNIGADTNLDTILPNWIGYDTTPLETGARSLIDRDKKTTSLTNEFVEKTVDNFLDERILKAIAVGRESKEGVAMYRLSLKADPELIDYIYHKVTGNGENKASQSLMEYKPSDSIKDLEINLWLGEKDHYIRELTSSFKLITPSSGGSSLGMLSALTGGMPEELPVAIVIKLADFGKAVTVEKPASYITPEEYFGMLTAASPYIKTQQELAKDAKRKADINILRTALEYCYSDSPEAKYAVKLEDLITCNAIKVAPADPDTNEAYFYQPNALRTGYTLKAALSTGKTYEATENGVGEN